MLEFLPYCKPKRRSHSSAQHVVATVRPHVCKKSYVSDSVFRPVAGGSTSWKTQTCTSSESLSILMQRAMAGRPFGPSMKRPTRFPRFARSSAGSREPLSPIRASTFGKALRCFMAPAAFVAHLPPSFWSAMSTVAIWTPPPWKNRAISSALRPAPVPDSRTTSTFRRSITVSSATASLCPTPHSCPAMASVVARMRLSRDWAWASSESRLRGGPPGDGAAGAPAPRDTFEAPTGEPPESTPLDGSALSIRVPPSPSLGADQEQGHGQAAPPALLS
mmetsp:Transcript_25218/g.71103  ORF Transcript_25218/g.71103 Transcript_25218/m.71103 type:complete len:276 (+) Transcript_25218:114-941(+)